MDFNLTNKVVIITGAGSGIGYASAKAFLAEGAIVIGVDINPDALNELHALGQIIPMKVDMTDQIQVTKLTDDVVKEFNRIDVLFNNAGIAGSRSGFLNITDEEWLTTLNLNVLGYVRASRAIIPYMLKQGNGVLLHTASEAGRMPNAKLPDYSVSKAAVTMLSKTIANEFTARGVRSNVLSPGFIRTAIYDKAGGLADVLARQYGVDRETALQRYVEAQKIPVGRLGKPEEVAYLALYLASDLANFISGANFTMDGGITPVVY